MVSTSAAPGPVINQAVVSGVFDVNPANNQAFDRVIVGNPPADVSVTKAGPPTINAGSAITYTINLANAGPNPASTVSLVDPLPASVTFTSLTTPAGWACVTPAVGSTGTIMCSIGTLAAGAAAGPFTVSGTVSATATGTLTNTATVTTASADPNPGNNSATASTDVLVVPTSADVSVTKTAPPTVNQGAALVYTLSVSNAGPDAASTVSLVDTLPASVTFASLTAPAGWACATPAVGSTGTITCTIAALASGGTAGPFSISGVVSATATGTLTNTATVATASADPNPGNNSAQASTTVIGPPPPTSLTLGLSFSPPTYYAAGQAITVRYLVTNTSAVTVTGIVVTDPKVPVITCPQTTLATGAAMTCTGPYTTTAADISAGVSAFTATVTGSGGATATATGSITSTAAAVQNAFNQLTPMPVRVDPPGLHDRIGAAGASLSESGGEPTLNFSASFLTGAGEAAADLAGGAVQPGFKLWIDGSLTLHTENIGNGVTGMIGLGGDYLVNEDLLIGAALYLDIQSRFLNAGTLKGRGFVVGPYVSAAVAPNVTIDAALFFGGSIQDAAATVNGVAFSGSYSTQRVLARAKLDGLWEMGDFVIRPDATFYLSHETAGAYPSVTRRGTPSPSPALRAHTSTCRAAPSCSGQSSSRTASSSSPMPGSVSVSAVRGQRSRSTIPMARHRSALSCKATPGSSTRRSRAASSRRASRCSATRPASPASSSRWNEASRRFTSR